MNLTGIRQKVFLDRYALKDKSGAPIEKTPEEMWRRVAHAIAAVEPKRERSHWEEQFFGAMSDFVLVPGGRILSGAGTGYKVTFYNCLPPDQNVLTPDGYKPIGEVKVGDTVITGKKRARRVNGVFVRETEEPLFVIKPTKLGFDDVRVTGEHPVLAIKQEWVNRHRSRDGLHLQEKPQWIKAVDLRRGDFVAVAWNQHIGAVSNIHLKDYLPETFTRRGDVVTKSQLKKPVKEEIDIDKRFMLLAGTWLGDGCVTHRTGTTIPAGIQITFNADQRERAEEIAGIMEEKFAVVPTVREDRWGQRLIQVRVESYPVGLFFKNFFGAYSYKKRIPQLLMEQPKERILPLIKGLFRSDGYLSKNNLGIALSNKALAVQLHELLLRTGRFFTIFQNNAKGGRHDTYRVSAGVSQANGLCEYIFGEKKTNVHHDQDYFLMHDDLFWVRIDAIDTVPYKGKVYDLEVEEDHSFITGGIVVSNCFVIPSPHDSRGGILSTLSQMVEIMSRGGGVGINLSSLRPRGSRVKKVNGFSSGPCNWAELFSVATKDIIQQGGCFAPGTRIMTHLGLVPIEEMVERRKRYFAATHQGYKEVTAKFDNGTKNVYEVTTASGLCVSVTAEHKFLTFNENGEFFLTPLSDLKEGDHTVMLLGDWRDDVPLVPLSTSVPKPSKYSYGRKDIVLPTEFTEDLAFLMGCYHADGSKVSDEYSPNGKGIRIAMAHDRPKDLETLIAAIRRCFGVGAKLHHGDGAVWDVEVFSRSLNDYLAENKLMKASSITVTVPEQVFRSPKSVAAAYIAGVFLGDGTNRGGKGGLRIATVSQQFAQELQLLLFNLGIASRIKVQERQEKGWRTLYAVTVNGATFMKRFANLLAPWTEKVADHRVSVRDGAFGWPFNVVDRFAYLANFQRTMARTNPTTSQKATLFLQEHVQSIHRSDRPNVELLASCVPDTIASITPKGTSQVYDLEIDDVHLLSGNGFYTSNSRRGALMLMLWDWHPDVEEFITVKEDLTRINGANLSVCVSDSFMEAVKNDRDWDLIFPDTTDPDYDTKWDGYMANWLALGKKPLVKKTVKARNLWDMVAKAAWRSAEPGVVFMERYNKWFNNYYWEYVNCVNPCVTADTLVSTTNGIRSIGELYNEGKPFAVTVDGKQFLSSPVFKTGTKQIYRLITREGYQLRLTHDHKVFTTAGKVEAGKLEAGDKLVLTTGGSFGVLGTHEEGQVLGWLVGDGSMKKEVATLYFYRKEKEELAPRFAQMVAAMVDGEQVVSRSYPIAPQYIEKEDKAVIESVRLWRMAKRYGLSHENKYLVPPAVFTGSEAMQRGFLQGLFSSDGHVAGTAEKGVSVRLTSVSKDLLVHVQRLLLNFGIVSRIYENRRDAGDRMLPNGKGSNALYHCQAYHDLVISKSDLYLFASLIGFLQEQKQEKLRSLLATYIRGPYKKSFTATFDHLEEDGIEDVFDIMVSDVHRFAANGIIVSNCGEEGLPNWGVCNLTSINLANLVDDKGQMNYQRLVEIAKIGVRFQDDVIDADFYVFDEIKKRQMEGERRIGLGTMGLGDALIKMKLRYGSQESLPVIDKIYKTIRDAAYEASVDIAAEKGPFPAINIKKHLEAYFIKQLPEAIRKKMKKHGVRNSVILQQAPTGSTSLLSGVSSGIEPVYEFEFIRRDRLGEHILRHPHFDAWFDEFKKMNGREPTKEERPDYFVSANDLTPEDHVYVQAAIQKYVDASISKTVNAPKNHTVEDVKRLYMLAYDQGCKGITYMRAESRPGVLTRIDEDKKKESAEEVKVGGQYIPEVKPRPMVVAGSTYQVETPVGQAYVTINTNGGNQPLEVFVNVGKAGSDVTAMAEAMGRLISLTLRLASPVTPMERAHKIAAELIGIGGARSLGFGENRVRSLPDAVAKVIDRHFGFFGKPKFDHVSNGETRANGNGVTKTVQEPVVEPAEQPLVPPGQQMIFTEKRMVTVDLCPSCGEGTLVFEESCKKCYSCGYSEC